MVGLSGLWMPIVLSAVAVFIGSSIVHMVIKWHNTEYKPVPNQDAVGDALRGFNIAPGEYMLPFPADMKEMGTPEFKARLERGPNIMMNVRANEMSSMGKMLGWWFVYSLVVSVFTAYLTGRTLGPGTEYLRVFRVSGTVAFAGYALAHWQYWDPFQRIHI